MNDRELLLFSDLSSYVVEGKQNHYNEIKTKAFDWKYKLTKTIGVISLLSFLSCLSWREYRKAEFDTHCTENLMYAAKADSLPQAQISLARAAEYLSSQKMIWGNTDVYFESDEMNDLNAFRGKLLTLYDHAGSVDRNFQYTEYDTEVDVDLKLASLHRSLISIRSGSEEVMKPKNIEYYPYHFSSFLWLWISACVAAIFIFISTFLTPKK